MAKNRGPPGTLADAKVYMVEIRAHNWEGLCAFYHETLGLPEQMRDDTAGFAMYGASEPFLAVVRKPAGGPRGPPRVVVDLIIGELDGALARLSAAGVRVLSPPKDSPEGYRIARIADPEGNELHLFAWSKSRSP